GVSGPQPNQNFPPPGGFVRLPFSGHCAQVKRFCLQKLVVSFVNARQVSLGRSHQIGISHQPRQTQLGHVQGQQLVVSSQGQGGGAHSGDCFCLSQPVLSARKSGPPLAVVLQ